MPARLFRGPSRVVGAIAARRSLLRRNVFALATVRIPLALPLFVMGIGSLRR